MLQWLLDHGRDLSGLAAFLGGLWAAARHIISAIERQLTHHLSNTFATRIDVKRVEKKVDLLAGLVGDQNAANERRVKENYKREYPGNGEIRS